MDRNNVLEEAFYPTLSSVRVRVNAIRREDPSFIRMHDIWVEDTRTGTEFHVDQNYNLVEM
jgi:hypothetical protein